MGTQQDKREQMILDVAKKHFEKFGYKRTVIDDIVREVGIAKGTFYLHFKSKQELYLHVMKRLQEEAIAAIIKQFQEEQTPAELVRNMIQLGIELLENEPLSLAMVRGEESHYMIQAMMAGPGVAEQLNSSLHFYKGVMEEGIRVGEFREDLDMEIYPYLLGSFKFLFLYVDIVESLGVPREKLWDAYIDMMMRGMLKPGVQVADPRYRRKWGNPFAA